MKEYGMAIELIGDSPEATPEEIAEGQRLIDFNFRQTREAHPEYGLSSYRFVRGPSLEAWDYEDCTACHGDGAWDQYNEDGSWDEKYECPGCGGAGRIAVKVTDPPQWRHNFGWYCVVE